MNQKLEEKELQVFDGWTMLVVILFIIVLSFLFFNNVVFYIGLVPIIFGILAGFFVLDPNEAIIGTFFGNYVGSKKDAGFFWVNPLVRKNKLSIRINNLATQKMKVNDKSGNPIEISAVFVWRISDTAKAMFSIEIPVEFLNNQCESALRQLASNFNYDEEGGHNLKSDADYINKILKENLNKLTSFAGLEILDARLVHLAYAPEIAQSMLKKQQAEAIIAARKKIVNGAVYMVKDVFDEMEKLNMPEFKDADKIKLIGNLMTVLVSDNNTVQTVELSSSSE